MRWFYASGWIIGRKRGQEGRITIEKILNWLGEEIPVVRSKGGTLAVLDPDDPTQRTEGPLEPVFVFPGEAVEIMVEDSVEGGPLGPPGAVEFRFNDSY